MQSSQAKKLNQPTKNKKNYPQLISQSHWFLHIPDSDWRQVKDWMNSVEFKRKDDFFYNFILIYFGGRLGVVENRAKKMI